MSAWKYLKKSLEIVYYIIKGLMSMKTLDFPSYHIRCMTLVSRMAPMCYPETCVIRTSLFQGISIIWGRRAPPFTCHECLHVWDWSLMRCELLLVWETRLQGLLGDKGSGRVCTGAFLGDRPAPNGLSLDPGCCFCGIVFNYSDSDLSGSDRCCCC